MTAAAPTTPKHGPITTVPAPEGNKGPLNTPKTPTSPAPAAPLGELVRIPLTQLVESKWNPRERFDTKKLDELAESLRTQGQLAPIVVRPVVRKGSKYGDEATPYYEIGAGHRRYRAAQVAGLTSLLSVVRDIDDVTFLELLVFENGNRNDLHALEEAAGYKRLMEQAGYTVPRIAERDGRSIEYVYSRLKLLQLIPLAKKLFLADEFTPGHAILIARLKPADQARLIGTAKEYWDDGALFIGEDALDIPGKRYSDETVKPISVRELERWIAEQVRFRPEETDPVLFPETAATLAQAAETQMKVVQITHEFYIQDEARDAKVKTIMPHSWKRADGQRGSKKCEHRVMGVIATGPGYGDAFFVCVAKEKCATHWPEQFKKAQARKKAAKATAKRRPASSGGATPAREPSEADVRRTEATEAREAFESELLEATWSKVLEDRKADFVAGAKRRMQQFAKVPNDVILLFGDPNTELYLPNHTEYNEQIEKVVWPALPGKWQKGYQWSPRDAVAGRWDLGLQMYFALDVVKLDAALEDAVESSMKAMMKEYDAKVAAAAKEKKPAKPAKKKAKKKGGRK